MDDRMKESISALLDNEADELELRRVLNHSDDTDVKAVWSRYNKVSDLLSSGQSIYEDNLNEKSSADKSMNSSLFLDIDISAQVSRSIDQIEGRQTEVASNIAGTQAAASRSNKRFGFISVAAVAASVVAVLLVFKPLGGDVETNNEMLAASNNIANDSRVDSVPMVQRPFSPEHARMLNQYLLRHAENSVAGGRSGLMPLARVASFSIAEN